MVNQIIRNIFSKLFISAAILFLTNFVYAAEPEIGMPAPDFKIMSGSNEELTLDDIKGRVAVIFYETKDTIEKNRKLKNELNKFYDAEPDNAKKSILRVPVINCRGVFFTEVWKNNLKENSKKEGITIYGDWDGKMFLAYGIKDKESNLIIIGRDGIIKYFFAGKAEDKDFDRIKDLLAAGATLP